MVLVIFSSCKDKQKSKEVAGEELVSPPPPPQSSSSSSYGLENGDTIWVVVDEMPEFGGGELALLDYLSKNIKYPEESKSKGIQGRVIVRFVVETDGSIDRVRILKGVDPELDAEALRVVKSLPQFEKPGREDGRIVPVWYIVPVIFMLE